MRLIDADALLRGICGERCGCEPDQCGLIDEYPNKRCKAGQYVEDAPTVDAVPVVRGEWIDSPTGDYAICSYCHVEWNVFDNDTYRFRHCPACGAKMEDKPCE